MENYFQAVTDGKLWCMERLVFQQIMQATGIKQMENQLSFLKSVPLLSTFPHDILAKISDVLELEVYKKGKTNNESPAVDMFLLNFNL